VDGSCRLVSSSVSGGTWWNAHVPNDNTTLGTDW